MEDNFRFKVNLGGMIDILSNHLYSSPNVFVRELLQNGVDAIKARQVFDQTFKGGKITVTVYENQELKQLTFQDNGTGLTESEIHQFLSIIGESSKRNLISNQASADFIGRFGIGLLSCFMVSDEIKVITKSIKDSKVSEWIGYPDGTYSLRQIHVECEYGTQITLTCKLESEHYYSYQKLEELIKYYGGALLVPIYLNDIQLNNKQVVWSHQLSKEQILQIGENIFEQRFIDYIPLSSKSGQVKGVAYIVSHKVASNSKNTHRIYLKNMLLTEKSENILPEWAFFLKCIINTDGLRPTASRESFYEDDVLEKTREELGECITEYFITLADTNPKVLSQIVSTHDLAIKSLSLENDQLYKIFINYFTFETSLGRKTGKDLIDEEQVIPYTNSVDQFRQVAPMFAAQNKLFVNGGYVYMKEIIEKLPEFYPSIFVDFVDTVDLIQVMDDLNIEEEKDTSDFIKNASEILSEFGCKVSLRRFEPNVLPAVFLINEDALFYKEIKNTKEKSNHPLSDFLDGFVSDFEESSYSELILNFSNPLINKIVQLIDLEALNHSVQLIYVQSLLLGHYPLGYQELKILNNGIISMLEWGLNKWIVN